MRGRLLEAERPGGGHGGDAGDRGDAAWPAQGLAFPRFSLSRIQILPHWKKPRSRSLILAKKSPSLDVPTRPNWEEKQRRETLGRHPGVRVTPPGTKPTAAGEESE